MTKSLATAHLYVPHGDVETRVWFLVPLRLYTGFILLVAALAKVAQGALSDPAQFVQAQSALIHHEWFRYGWYTAFYDGVVMQYPGLFIFLLVFGELFVGVLVFVGAFTRLACYGGMLLMVNAALAQNASLLQHNSATAYFFIFLTLAMTAAGRAYGVDHYLKKHVSTVLG